MGTLLAASGRLPAGRPPEELNSAAADVVFAAHRAYIEAGAQIIETNSFGGNRIALQRAGMAERARELNVAAARIARDAAGHTTLVAGSIGPLGEMVEPWGPVPFAEAKAIFAEQAAALAEGGADLLIIETLFDLEEMRAAIEGAQETGLPIAATMTFDKGGRTVMGVRPEDAARSLLGMGAEAIGSNCGLGPEATARAVGAMIAVCPQATFIAQPNAGLPRLEAGVTRFDATPAEMAHYALRFVEMGVHIVGGCCGTTPGHIRAIAQAVRAK